MARLLWEWVVSWCGCRAQIANATTVQEVEELERALRMGEMPARRVVIGHSRLVRSHGFAPGDNGAVPMGDAELTLERSRPFAASAWARRTGSTGKPWRLSMMVGLTLGAGPGSRAGSVGQSLRESLRCPHRRSYICAGPCWLPVMLSVCLVRPCASLPPCSGYLSLHPACGAACGSVGSPARASIASSVFKAPRL